MDSTTILFSVSFRTTKNGRGTPQRSQIVWGNLQAVFLETNISRRPGSLSTAAVRLTHFYGLVNENSADHE